MSAHFSDSNGAGFSGAITMTVAAGAEEAPLLPRLYERDIDVILQEELLFNEHLGVLIAKALRLGPDIEFTRCDLSVSDDTGETDVLAHFKSGNVTGCLLIENKIDAQFQPRQPERYRERALSHMAADPESKALSILVAPQTYIQNGGDSVAFFDAMLSYEEIAGAIKCDCGPRSAHRAALLLRAVDQARKAYVLVPSEQVGDLWGRIYAVASKEFPSLRMAAPGEKGSHSKWLIFKANLPPKVTIDWKITKGTVDLSFWKAARDMLPSSLDFSNVPSAQRVVLGETTAISVNVPKPPEVWTEIGESEIRSALAAAKALLDFYGSNIANSGRQPQ
jgi:hypothetical protein